MCRDYLGCQFENIGGGRIHGHLGSFAKRNILQIRRHKPFRNRYFSDQELDKNMEEKQASDQELDITAEVCPMTFVRTRLALDRMAPGQILRVRLRGAEPLRNVPRTARELGHEVLSMDTGADGVATLLLRRGG
jgi:TusA-related sulfurtransferase